MIGCTRKSRKALVKIVRAYRGRAAEPGQDLLGHDRLHQEEQEGAREDRQGIQRHDIKYLIIDEFLFCGCRAPRRVPIQRKKPAADDAAGCTVLRRAAL